jgi:hypothetical protein
VIYGDPLFLDVMGKCEERVVSRGSQEIEILQSFMSVTRVLWPAGGKHMWENDHKTLLSLLSLWRMNFTRAVI